MIRRRSYYVGSQKLDQKTIPLPALLNQILTRIEAAKREGKTKLEHVWALKTSDGKFYFPTPEEKAELGKLLKLSGYRVEYFPDSAKSKPSIDAHTDITWEE